MAKTTKYPDTLFVHREGTGDLSYLVADESAGKKSTGEGVIEAAEYRLVRRVRIVTATTITTEPAPRAKRR